MQKQTITIHYFAFIHTKKTVKEARDKATNTSCACKKERNLNVGGNRLLTRCCCALLRSFPNLIRSKDWFPMFPFILVAVRRGIAELVFFSAGFDCWKARGFTESREEKQTSLQSFTKEHEIDWTILKMKERVGESGSSIQIEFGGLGQEVKYSRGDCFYAKCIV